MQFPKVFAIRILLDGSSHWFLFTDKHQLLDNAQEPLDEARDRWERHLGPINNLVVVDRYCGSLQEAVERMQSALATPIDSKQRASGEKS